jgi:hypothetical protein
LILVVLEVVAAGVLEVDLFFEQDCWFAKQLGNTALDPFIIGTTRENPRETDRSSRCD